MAVTPTKRGGRPTTDNRLLEIIMSKILILYGTDYGHTRKVAQHIAEVINERGHVTELVQGNKSPRDFTVDGFDGAIIGTSIHMGVHQISVKKLVKAQKEALSKIPSAYFCVCLTAYSSKAEDKKQVESFINDFLKYTGLKPVVSTAFAGALRYPHYNFARRYMAKLVARKVGADTDTKQEHYEYTDWNAVNRFAEEFVDSI